MSMKMKKAGLFINWQRSFSILAPFKKGKGDRDAVLSSEVVLTKVKLLNNFHENRLVADDSVSTISTVSSPDTDHVDHAEASEVNSHLKDMSNQPQMESGSDYLSTIFSDRLYKFESEDSGVELASGAHSPSTPTGSEQSLVVHSRESSCDSSNVNPDHTCPSSKLVLDAQSAETKNVKEQVDNGLETAADTQESVLTHRQECSSSAAEAQLHICEDLDQSRPSETSCEGEGEKPQPSEEISISEDVCSEDMRESRDERTDAEATSVRQSVSSESLEDYMDECCRLSQTQQQNSGPLGSGPLGSGPLGSVPLGSGPLGSGPLGSGPMDSGPLGSGPLASGPLGSGPLGSGPLGSGPLGSGPMDSGPLGSGPLGSGPMDSGPLGSGPLGSGPLGSGPLGSGLAYLEHICQLIEKIGQLQKLNLRLQRHICSLQKDGRMSSTKEDLFQQLCICGAAGLAFQEIPGKELLPSSGTASDLSTIPETKGHLLRPSRRGTSGECLTSVPTWSRSTNRRSYAEGEACVLRDDGEGLPPPQRRLSDIYSWSRVRELLRKTGVKNQSRLERTSSPLKMSCPQLYRPDLESAETAYRNRNSMFDFGNQSKLDLSWFP